MIGLLKLPIQEIIALCFIETGEFPLSHIFKQFHLANSNLAGDVRSFLCIRRTRTAGSESYSILTALYRWIETICLDE